MGCARLDEAGERGAAAVEALARVAVVDVEDDLLFGLGAVGQVAVPISVVSPSNGMLVLSPPGRTNAKLFEPLAESHFAPLSPVAVALMAVGCDVGLAYTQYLTRPGTPPDGFWSVSE